MEIFFFILDVFVGVLIGLYLGRDPRGKDGRFKKKHWWQKL